MPKTNHIVIIGNGISGVTTARHIRKHSDSHITIISGESDYFFSRTALMYVFMGHMKFEHTQPYENWFWKKNKIELVNGWVIDIDVNKKTIGLGDQSNIDYDQLVLATGSTSNKFGWAGQDLRGVSGLYSKQDLEYIEKHTAGIKKAVIVGGGLIGIELAEMLISRQIDVTFLVREANFWDIVLPEEESKMINKEILRHEVDLRLSTELKEICEDGQGNVRSIITNTGEVLECQFVGLTVGVSPNIGWLKGSEIETNRGILVDEYLQTNVKDIYAIGDCAEMRSPNEGRRALEQVWYTGRMMGETLAKSLTGSKTSYRPGIWFNSAKFFNIEYQTYGTVTPQLGPDQESFYWEHADQKKSLRIVFLEKTTEVIGVNVMGIRMRHEVWDEWIKDKKTITYVLENLEQVNFDPEFFTKHEASIRASFNNEYDYMQVTNQKPSLFQKIFS